MNIREATDTLYAVVNHQWFQTLSNESGAFVLELIDDMGEDVRIEAFDMESLMAQAAREIENRGG